MDCNYKITLKTCYDCNYKITLKTCYEFENILRYVSRLIRHEKVYEHKKKLTNFLTYANIVGK